MFFNLKKSGEGRRVAGPILVIRTSANGVKNPPRRNQQEETQPRVVTEGIVFETSEDLHQ